SKPHSEGRNQIEEGRRDFVAKCCKKISRKNGKFQPGGFRKVPFRRSHPIFSDISHGPIQPAVVVGERAKKPGVNLAHPVGLEGEINEQV
ncbi:MAG TPA: hypothetical protein VFE51_11120, partial [Verrucomicrobiae bacterium]|nr:hypothetical protein [Verrucomicrobiae bacterium]